MSYKIVVSPIALKNIEEGVEYYLFKASKKVALDFLNDYKKVYKTLQINPFYQFHDTNYRFLPLKNSHILLFSLLMSYLKLFF